MASSPVEYIEIDSTYRDRNEFPDPGEFIVPFTSAEPNNPVQMRDAVTLEASLVPGSNTPDPWNLYALNMFSDVAKCPLTPDSVAVPPATAINSATRKNVGQMLSQGGKEGPAPTTATVDSSQTRRTLVVPVLIMDASSDLLTFYVKQYNVVGTPPQSPQQSWLNQQFGAYNGAIFSQQNPYAAVDATAASNRSVITAYEYIGQGIAKITVESGISIPSNAAAFETVPFYIQTATMPGFKSEAGDVVPSMTGQIFVPFGSDADAAYTGKFLVNEKRNQWRQIRVYSDDRHLMTLDTSGGNGYPAQGAGPNTRSDIVPASRLFCTAASGGPPPTTPQTDFDIVGQTLISPWNTWQPFDTTSIRAHPATEVALFGLDTTEVTPNALKTVRVASASALADLQPQRVQRFGGVVSFLSIVSAGSGFVAGTTGYPATGGSGTGLQVYALNVDGTGSLQQVSPGGTSVLTVVANTSRDYRVGDVVTIGSGADTATLVVSGVFGVRNKELHDVYWQQPSKTTFIVPRNVTSDDTDEGMQFSAPLQGSRSPNLKPGDFIEPMFGNAYHDPNIECVRSNSSVGVNTNQLFTVAVGMSFNAGNAESPPFLHGINQHATMLQSMVAVNVGDRVCGHITPITSEEQILPGEGDANGVFTLSVVNPSSDVKLGQVVRFPEGAGIANGTYICEITTLPPNAVSVTVCNADGSLADLSTVVAPDDEMYVSRMWAPGFGSGPISGTTLDTTQTNSTPAVSLQARGASFNLSPDTTVVGVQYDERDTLPNNVSGAVNNYNNFIYLSDQRDVDGNQISDGVAATSPAMTQPYPPIDPGPATVLTRSQPQYSRISRIAGLTIDEPGLPDNTYLIAPNFNTQPPVQIYGGGGKPFSVELIYDTSQFDPSPPALATAGYRTQFPRDLTPGASFYIRDQNVTPGVADPDLGTTPTQAVPAGPFVRWSNNQAFNVPRYNDAYVGMKIVVTDSTVSNTANIGNPTIVLESTITGYEYIQQYSDDSSKSEFNQMTSHYGILTVDPPLALPTGIAPHAKNTMTVMIIPRRETRQISKYVNYSGKVVESIPDGSNKIVFPPGDPLGDLDGLYVTVGTARYERQIRKIVAYDSSTRSAYVDSPFTQGYAGTADYNDLARSRLKKAITVTGTMDTLTSTVKTSTRGMITFISAADQDGVPYTLDAKDIGRRLTGYEEIRTPPIPVGAIACETSGGGTTTITVKFASPLPTGSVKAGDEVVSFSNVTSSNPILEDTNKGLPPGMYVHIVTGSPITQIQVQAQPGAINLNVTDSPLNVFDNFITFFTGFRDIGVRVSSLMWSRHAVLKSIPTSTTGKVMVFDENTMRPFNLQRINFPSPAIPAVEPRTCRFYFEPIDNPGANFRINSGQVSENFTAPLLMNLGGDGHQANQRVLVTTGAYENGSSLLYSGSLIGQNQMVCYEITLVNLILPNAPLLGGTGGRIAFYPYVYVQLENVSGASSQNPVNFYSNNPSSKHMMFRVAIEDVNNPLITPFVKLNGGGQTMTVKFKPNDALRVSVRLPNGELFRTILSENSPPTVPNPYAQLSMMFGIRRVR
jgi:hypothetical protein